MNRALATSPDLDSLVPAVPFSRRGFIASSLAAGFAVSAGPLMAQRKRMLAWFKKHGV